VREATRVLSIPLCLLGMAAVTSVAGDASAESVDHREEDGGDLLRESAQAVGSAVHRILESLDLAQDLTSQLREAGGRAAASLAAVVGRRRAAEARSRLRVLLAAIRHSARGGTTRVHFPERAPARVT